MEHHAAVERLKKFRKQTLSSQIEENVVVATEAQSELPELFNELTKKRKKTTEKLQKIDTSSLDIAGGLLSSFMSLASACGPLCAHAVLAATTGPTFSPLQIGDFERKDTKTQQRTLKRYPALTASPKNRHASLTSNSKRMFQAQRKEGNSFEESLALLSTSWVNLLWDAFIPTPQTR